MKLIDLGLKGIFESKEYKIKKSKKFNKFKIKYSNKKSNIKLLDNLVKTLQKEGEIVDHGVHRINQPIYSEYTGGNETGWQSVYISKSDDLRLMYKRFNDGVIEVKFGKATDVGYTH